MSLRCGKWCSNYMRGDRGSSKDSGCCSEKLMFSHIDRWFEIVIPYSSSKFP